MKKTELIIPLFEKFIRDTRVGKRLKADGTPIKQGTITNYQSVLTNLTNFVESRNYDLRICDYSKLTTRERTSEQNYWRRFNKNFSTYLYTFSYDNFVGFNMKIVRTFLKDLENRKGFNIGPYYKLLHVITEEREINILTPNRLKLLIHNKELESKLNEKQRIVKDMFVIGCTTGLRYSDLIALNSVNFKTIHNNLYLQLKSKKTKTFSNILLPQYAIEILKKYSTTNKTAKFFPKYALDHFNEQLKLIGAKASFDDYILNLREKRGVEKEVIRGTKVIKFYEKMSSHMMRRTAITTMLLLGMPELMVRQISGHKDNSKAFYRYVRFTQSFLDQELTNVHLKLESYE